MRLRSILWLVILLAWPAWAAPSGAPKRMLVLFKSSEKLSATQNPVRWHLDAILRKQGWSVDYHDADKSLPAAAAMQPYQAVLTWHTSAQYSHPQDYVNWMRDQLVAGRKVVVLGNFGAHSPDLKTWLSDEQLNAFFLPFGLQSGSAYSGDSAKLELVKQSAIAHAPNPPTYYLLYKSINTDNEPLVVVRRKDLADSDSAVVVRTPRGGMVCDGYLYKQTGNKLDWYLDRERFLAEALAQKAEDAASSGGNLLALYKGGEGVDANTNFIARFLKDPLKDLGYTVVYRDIERGFPTAAEMAAYNGVITWYQTASMENASAYCQWLTDQILAGRKVVVLGNLGAFQELDKHSNPPTERWLLTHEYNNFLYPFGLEFKGMWTKDNQVLDIESRDAKMVPNLEKSQLGHYYWLDSVNPDNQVYLSVRRSDAKDSDSAFVVRTPYGGFILESYLFRDLSGHGEYTWHVDMKRFLRDCLTYKAKTMPTAWRYEVKPQNLSPVEAASTLPPQPSLPAGSQELKRRILAFYQKDQQESSEQNRIHNVVESFLNYLGLVVDYRAIEDGLPSSAEMERYRGIITWFAGASVPGAQEYTAWLKGQIESGKLVVILGDYGAYQDKNLASQVDPGPTLKALGIDFRAASPVTGIKISRTNISTQGNASIEYLDPTMCKAEHPIDLSDRDLRKGWPVYLSADPANKVYLKVKDPEGQVCDAVTVTPHGGVVAGEFLFYIPPAMPIRTESADPGRAGMGPAVADETELPELRIDAFRFFAEAFQVENFPRPDVTTLNGSRIYFSHIDGDAMQGMSFIDKASLNAEMLYREILSVYKLPVTVSFVTANLQAKATATYKRELEAARKILALPWIEVACHTENHPFNWRLGDLRRRPGSDEVRLVRIPPEDQQEIAYSVAFTNQYVAPAAKRCKVLLWSGMCNPAEKELALCDALGVANFNGGDPVYDSVHPFLAGVSPLYAVVGGRYQFHTCAAGDFYYTGAWTRDYDGMKRLVEYFKYTEQPRRLRAMNLYYHFYLAERALGITGLKIAMDYVLSQQPAPMFVSNYVDIVKDFIVTRLATDASGAILVANSGPMRTIRFDTPTGVVDVDASSGVLGYLRESNRLYVHLDEGKQHRIVLGKTEPKRLYLERASHYLDAWKATKTGLSFRLKGVGPAFFTLKGAQSGKAYKVNIEGLGPTTITADGAGQLHWEGELLRYDGTYAVTISG